MLIKKVSARSILTSSTMINADFSANPYVGCPHACKFCNADYMKSFTHHTEDWGEFLDIKMWKPLKNVQKYKDQEIFIGTVTDPYNPWEETYRRTRTLLEELRGSGAKITIQTRSDLVLQDLELLKEFDEPCVELSINTLDEAFKGDTEKTVSVEARLNALKKLHEAGIKTVCVISPIFPEITDVFAIIEKVKDDCDLIRLESLGLFGANKDFFLNYIEETRPELILLYKTMYNKHIDAYWNELDEKIAAYAKAHGMAYLYGDKNAKRFASPPTLLNRFAGMEAKEDEDEEDEESIEEAEQS